MYAGLKFADWLQLVCMIGSVWQDDNLQTGNPACLVAMYTVRHWHNGVCYVHCIQWEVGTMWFAICCVGHLHWYNDKCIANGACLLYMFILYCGDLLICSLHWLGHNASCEGSSSFRWDRPDIYILYTLHKQLQCLPTLPVAIHFYCLDNDQTNFVLRHW